jgi:hypothetical protein
MPNAMPGFAFITGLFSCFNRRVLDPEKPKTVTFDAEIPIGDDQNGQLQCIRGIVHYFVPQNTPKPDDDHKYCIAGKVISIHSQSHLEDGAFPDYDLEIEALTVSKFSHSSLTIVVIDFSCS